MPLVTITRHFKGRVAACEIVIGGTDHPGNRPRLSLAHLCGKSINHLQQRRIEHVPYLGLDALLYELSLVVRPAYHEAQIAARNWRLVEEMPAFAPTHLKRWRL